MTPKSAVPSITYERKTPCGTVYVVVRENGRLTDFTTHIGKPGGCVRCQSQVAWSLAALAISNGATLPEVVEAMSGHGCHLSSPTMPSCSSAIAEILEEHHNNRTQVAGTKN